MFEKWWETSLNGPHQKVFGHRRSIVRRIGSRLPLAQAKRVHLDLAVWRYNNEFEMSSNSSNSVSCISDFIDEGHGSISTEAGNPAPATNNDMKKLLDEILELKVKMNEILQKQSTNNICCGQSSCCNIGPTHKALEKPSNLPPPPPPPPPPPLPIPHLVLGNSTPKKSLKPIPRSNEHANAGGLSAVLNELKTSKLTLKHVQRSPGGRPLRDSGSESGTPRSDGGGDMLAEILRRRLSQTHGMPLDGLSNFRYIKSEVV
ncbi:hypothetical protein GE061_004586 [Apolygus lucorum]|uniref:Uncharacterized protein n=1 Tax=Apolygus lucorum TaxID=248454 RepID=A0A6A4J437_APOLU|nr:hypothetical protein GE061_004586 [Apolygus lucorum]